MQTNRPDQASGADVSRLRYALVPAPDAMILAPLWQRLEAAADASFFQSWGWIGTWYSALPRTLRVLLFSAYRDDEVVCLALLVAHLDKRHLLSETGDPTIDQLTIEHNGMLVARSCVPLLATAFLPQLLTMLPPKAQLVTSGVPEAYLTTQPGQEFSPAITGEKKSYLTQLDEMSADGLSALRRSVRAKVRRAERRYAAFGEVRLSEAGDSGKAVAAFDRLRILHQKYWEGRGKTGAFVDPFIVEFHRALIARRFAQGEIQLLHLAAGEETIGFLYNFRYRGRIYAYQSGFNYSLIEKERPGLLCHWHALRYNKEAGALVYDFLAGTNAMKEALANREETLYWLRFRRKSLRHAIAAGLRSTKQAAAHFARALRG
jgi:CelD/BcsL family acetyltransferase involved in cellulose biosynthesis